MTAITKQETKTVTGSSLSQTGQAVIFSAQKTKVEKMRNLVPAKTRDLYNQSSKYFRNTLAEFVYYRSYSRWIEEEGRRESWIETVDRYMNFMRENLGNKLNEKEYAEVREAILKQEAMPSMRLLQFAGGPAKHTNVAAYNCSFTAPTKLTDFAEIMYILMCGTGAGFSVERKFTEQLPQIKKQTGTKLDTYVIADSREGWADSLTHGLKTWYSGKDVDFDFSLIRPYGARLKTMGGRASGPDPLKDLLKFTKERVLSKQGRRLEPIDVHDIICKIGEVVVAGGVRRSALISLSDLDDQSVRDAKIGQFWNTNPQRSLSNNSAVYESKPSVEQFMEEWTALIKSGAGERGIFNRGGLSTALPERRVKHLKEGLDELGSNPCGEILLQPKQFCNLSEVVARSEDTEESLMRKIRVAAILGTYQSTLTNFPYLSKEWKQHCEAERLLGVSITGQYDCPAVRNADTLNKLKKEAVRVNRVYAKRFGVNASTSVTCVKPSGTVSQTVDCASGMHPRYAPYYIRRIRIAAHDPLFKLMKDQGVSYHPEVGQTAADANTWVLEFPIKAPENSVYRNDKTAVEQLEYWKVVKKEFTEHNPSITIYVGENEWLEVANWVYNNWDMVGGISFLPRSNFVYQLAPYEEISKEKYEEMMSKFPEVDYSLIVSYEAEDETELAKEAACAGANCELN